MISTKVLEKLDALFALRAACQTGNSVFGDLLRQLAELVHLEGSPLPETTAPEPVAAPIKVLEIGGFAGTLEKEKEKEKEIRITAVRPHTEGFTIFGLVNEIKFYCLWKLREEKKNPFVVDRTYTVPTETLKLTRHGGKDQWVPKFGAELSPGVKSFYSYISENCGVPDSRKQAGRKILAALQGHSPVSFSAEEFPPIKNVE